MKHLQFGLLTLFLFIVSFSRISAQQNHFIYIQTENKQAFYVKLDDKIYSSSGSGYLILPKLKDGTYRLLIGFPKSEWKEQSIDCLVNNDAGYLLKNFEEKGWGLFNLQTLGVVMSGESGKVTKEEVITKTDAFSNMLSNVVNDSTIRQTEIVKEEVKKVPENTVDPVLPAVTKEKEAVKDLVQQPKEETKITDREGATTGITKSEEITKPSNGQQGISINNKSSITRSLINKNTDGTEMVFIDEVNGKKDTIRVFIPAEKDFSPVIAEKAGETEKPKKDIKVEPVKEVAKTKDAKFLEIEIPNPNAKTEVVKPAESKPAQNVISNVIVTDNPMEKVIKKAEMINSDCKTLATDEDFLKLRKKMAAADNDDEMIALSKKIFKTKCFTVEQVKNLSVLFLKDAGKYAFFDMAYAFVSDSNNFSSLQSQLSETYYINRFQVMIRH